MYSLDILTREAKQINPILKILKNNGWQSTFYRILELSIWQVLL